MGIGQNSPLMYCNVTQVECRNYIRTLHKINSTSMYVCGTNAFSPTCDYLVSGHHICIPNNLRLHTCAVHDCLKVILDEQ